MILSASTPSPLCPALRLPLWRLPVAAAPEESLAGCLKWQWGTWARHLGADHTEWGSQVGRARRHNCGNRCSPWTEAIGTQDTERAPLQTRNWNIENAKDANKYTIWGKENQIFNLLGFHSSGKFNNKMKIVFYCNSCVDIKRKKKWMDCSCIATWTLTYHFWMHELL